MKKLTFLLVALVAASAPSFGQGFGWGVKAGLNISDMSNLSDTKSKAGLTAGVFADYKFNQWFALSADLLYSREGAKGDQATLKSNYLNLPILANFYVTDNLAFKIGVQPGVFLSAKNKYKDNGQDVTVSNGDAYKAMDFAFPIGVSYEFFDRLILDARYNIGVAKVLNADFTSHNNYFTITVGYRFK